MVKLTAKYTARGMRPDFGRIVVCETREDLDIC
jgi:hypothetical protein